MEREGREKEKWKILVEDEEESRGGKEENEGLQNKEAWRLTITVETLKIQNG